MSYRVRATFVIIVVASLVVVGHLGSQPIRALAAPPADCSGVTEIPLSECNALIDLYNQTNGAGWTIGTDQWTTTTPCSTPWYGITCNGGHVTAISLVGNKLTGTLPTTLNNLVNLQTLDLDSNQLSGSIPSLGSLTSLQTLNLYLNRLSGTIPTSYSSMTSLLYFNLHLNRLTGNIPDLTNLTNLQNLDFGSNQLTGPIPSLSTLTNLQYLDFSTNQLSGALPSLHGLTNLQLVFLFANQLTGTIPGLNGLSSLHTIQLGHNQLTGTLPDLSGVTTLQSIDLDNNQLSGSLAQLSFLTNPINLDLSYNRFGGSIPPLTGFSNLYGLYLDHNILTGTIPSLSGLNNLHMLYLNDNGLGGAVPASITGTALMAGGFLTLCGGPNYLTPPDSTTDVWIKARDTSWTLGVGCIPILTPPTPTATSSATLTPSTTSTAAPTITPSATLTLTPTSTTTLSITPSATPSSTAILPRIDSIGIYRAGTFYLRLHNSSGFADLTVAFNPAAQPYPIVGDWAGAGFDTVGVFDQTNGLFSLCIYNDTTFCADRANVKRVVLGSPGDVPLSGRWSVSATNAGIGVFRPSNGLIYLKNVLQSGYADETMVLGVPGDVGVAGDWTGQGFDSPGVYRPSVITFYLSNQVTNGPVIGDETLQYGYPTDLPVVGDWIGQGHDGVGLFRPSNGYTYLKNSLTTGFADETFVYGIAGDIPIAGHWQVTYPSAPIFNRLIVAATSAPVVPMTPSVAPSPTLHAGGFDG